MKQHTAIRRWLKVDIRHGGSIIVPATGRAMEAENISRAKDEASLIWASTAAKLEASALHYA